MAAEGDATPETSQGSQNTSAPSPILPQNEQVLPQEKQGPPDNPINVTVNLPHKHWTVDWLPIGINGALAVIGVIAICIYGGQLGAMKGQLTAMQGQLTEMQKQTLINRQQLVGSQAAVLDFGTAFSDSGQLQVWLNNNGHVTATDIHFRLDATKNVIKTGMRIGTALSFEPSVAPIQPTRGFNKTWSLPWQPAELGTHGKWPSGWPGTVTYTFWGSFSYQ